MRRRSETNECKFYMRFRPLRIVPKKKLDEFFSTARKNRYTHESSLALLLLLLVRMRKNIFVIRELKCVPNEGRNDLHKWNISRNIDKLFVENKKVFEVRAILQFSLNLWICVMDHLKKLIRVLSTHMR